MANLAENSFGYVKYSSKYVLQTNVHHKIIEYNSNNGITYRNSKDKSLNQVISRSLWIQKRIVLVKLGLYHGFGVIICNLTHNVTKHYVPATIDKPENIMSFHGKITN